MPTLMLRESLISYDGNARHYTVPAHIRNIATNAFYDTATLYQLTLPETMDSIGDNAFRMCFNMREIDMPKYCESVGSGLFQQCWVLEEVVLPEGTEKIGYDMFLSCNELSDITIPDSVEKIERAAFNSCKKLRYLRVSPERLSVIPHAFQPMAAITYMSEHQEGAGSEIVDEYVKGAERLAMDLAINRNEREAVQYMFAHDLVTAGEIPGYITRANELGRTEIAAMLLQHSVPAESEDLLDWDPFADL